MMAFGTRARREMGRRDGRRFSLVAFGAHREPARCAYAFPIGYRVDATCVKACDDLSRANRR